MQGKRQNTGIEILRIVATLMICMCHLLYMGGLLAAVHPGTPLYSAVWVLECLGASGANIYMLISGYVGVDTNWHPGRIVCLWLQVVILSLGETLISNFVTPGYVTPELYKMSVFPVIHNTFGYITAYCFAFFLFPFANAALKHMSKRQIYMLILVIFCFALYENHNGYLGFAGGYSANWLFALYCVGGGVRMLNIEKKLKSRQYIALYFLFSGICFMIKILGVKWNSPFLNNIATSYTNIPLILAALCLLCGFATMEINRMQKWIQSFSGACLGVYIMQCHPYFWSQHMGNYASHLTNRSVTGFLIATLILTLALFMGFAFVDLVRSFLFQIIGMDQKIKYIEKLLHNILKCS